MQLQLLADNGDVSYRQLQNQGTVLNGHKRQYPGFDKARGSQIDGGPRNVTRAERGPGVIEVFDRDISRTGELGLGQVLLGDDRSRLKSRVPPDRTVISGRDGPATVEGATRLHFEDGMR